MRCPSWVMSYFSLQIWIWILETFLLQTHQRESFMDGCCRILQVGRRWTCHHRHRWRGRMAEKIPDHLFWCTNYNEWMRINVCNTDVMSVYTQLNVHLPATRYLLDRSVYQTVHSRQVPLTTRYTGHTEHVFIQLATINIQLVHGVLKAKRLEIGLR